jgi:SAM-dependent methyltransferase
MGRRFDAAHGVVTQARLFLGELDPESIGDALAHATHYEPVPIRDANALFDALPTDIIRSATFLDVGSGLGRAVFVAMARPFKRIVGIDVSGALLETAKDNLARLRNLKVACRDVRLVHADARRYDYPPGNLIVFLYNPFDAAAFAVTLDRIYARRNPAATWLLYHTPPEGALALLEGYDFVAQTPAYIVARRRDDESC